MTTATAQCDSKNLHVEDAELDFASEWTAVTITETKDPTSLRTKYCTLKFLCIAFYALLGVTVVPFLAVVDLYRDPKGTSGMDDLRTALMVSRIILYSSAGVGLGLPAANCVKRRNWLAVVVLAAVGVSLCLFVYFKVGILGEYLHSTAFRKSMLCLDVILIVLLYLSVISNGCERCIIGKVNGNINKEEMARKRKKKFRIEDMM